MSFRKIDPALKPVAEKERNSGKFVDEIASELQISQATVSIWLRGHVPDKSVAKILAKRLARKRESYNRAKRRELQIRTAKSTKLLATTLSKLNFSALHDKLLCSFLYWAEGGKTESSVNFTNSDPKMIRVFLKLLRKNWRLEETKFRLTLHAHKYHDVTKLSNYWLKQTKIPLNQFTKIYVKPNGARNIRNGYKGTIRIRYYDVKIAREIKEIYNAYSVFAMGM